MSEIEISTLKNQAKTKVRKMVNMWMESSWEIKKNMLIISSGYVQGTIDKELVNSTFQKRLVAHIAANGLMDNSVLTSTIFFELLQEVFLEEIMALQN